MWYMHLRGDSAAGLRPLVLPERLPDLRPEDSVQIQNTRSRRFTEVVQEEAFGCAEMMNFVRLKNWHLEPSSL